MIGFFEYQYLSYKKNHIKNLLALARVDGFVHPKEEKMLFKIAKRYGLKERQVKTLIEESNTPFEVNVPDNYRDKLNLLYDLLLMIHADQVVDKSEVEFFEDAVKKLGFKKDMAKWLLSTFAEGAPTRTDEWEEIQQEAKEKFSLK